MITVTITKQVDDSRAAEERGEDLGHWLATREHEAHAGHDCIPQK